MSFKREPGLPWRIADLPLFADEGSVNPQRGHPPAEKQVTIIASGTAGFILLNRIIPTYFFTEFKTLRISAERFELSDQKAIIFAKPIFIF